MIATTVTVAPEAWHVVAPWWQTRAEERRAIARERNHHPFEATAMLSPHGLSRAYVNMGMTRFSIEVWRTAVVFPVLNHLLLPLVAAPTTYEPREVSGSPAVRSVTVTLPGHVEQGHAAECVFAALAPYWVTVHNDVIRTLLHGALASPATDPGRRLWGALAGFATAEVDDLPEHTPTESLTLTAALLTEPLWVAGGDSPHT